MKDACQAPDFASDIAPDMSCYFLLFVHWKLFFEGAIFDTCQAPDVEPDHAPDMYWYTTCNIKSDDVVLILVIKQVMALVKQCILVVIFVKPR